MTKTTEQLHEILDSPDHHLIGELVKVVDRFNLDRDDLRALLSDELICDVLAYVRADPGEEEDTWQSGMTERAN